MSGSLFQGMISKSRGRSSVPSLLSWSVEDSVCWCTGCAADAVDAGITRLLLSVTLAQLLIAGKPNVTHWSQGACRVGDGEAVLRLLLCNADRDVHMSVDFNGGRWRASGVTSSGQRVRPWFRWLVPCPNVLPPSPAPPSNSSTFVRSILSTQPPTARHRTRLASGRNFATCR